MPVSLGGFRGFAHLPRPQGWARLRATQPRTERPEIDLSVLASTGDVTGGVVENRLVESKSRDRRDERDEEEPSEDPSIPLILFQVALLPVCSRSGRAYPMVCLETSCRRCRGLIDLRTRRARLPALQNPCSAVQWTWDKRPLGVRGAVSLR